MSWHVVPQHVLANATAAAPCIYSRCHLGKAGLEQQICGLAHELPLLSSPAAFRLPAVKCAVQVSLCEVGQGFSNLLLLLHTAMQVAPPGVKSMALGAVCQIRHGPLRFALLVV